MKLGEFIDNLNELVKLNPNLLDATVVYAKDDEGNGFQEVHYEPSLGFFYDRREFDTYTLEELLDDEELEVNAVCIN